jgi:hypothetical protein
LFGGFSIEDNNGMKQRDRVCGGDAHFVKNIYVGRSFRLRSTNFLLPLLCFVEVNMRSINKIWE